MSTLTQNRISYKPYMVFGFFVLVTFAALAAGYSTWALEPKWAIFSIAGILFPFVMFIVRNVKRFLLGTLIFSIPLNADYNFVFHPSPGGADSFGIGLSDILLFLLLAYTLMQAARIKKSGTLQSYPSIMIPSLALIIMSLISMLAAKDIMWSMFDILNMLRAVLFFFLVANNIQNKNDIVFILLMLFLGLVFQAGIVCLQAFRGTTLGLAGLGEWDGMIDYNMVTTAAVRPGGTIGHVNHLARYLGLLVPIALILSLTFKSKKIRIISMFVAGAGIVALVYTLTRSSWIGLIVSTLTMVWLAFINNHFSLRALTRLAFAGVAFVIILVVFSDFIWGRIITDDFGSANTRITTSKVALNIIQDHPVIGVGINNYGSVLEQYWNVQDPFTRRAAVHNNFLLYAAEMGIIGLAIYLWLLGAAFQRILRAIKSYSKSLSIIAIGIMGSFTGYLVSALSDKSFKENLTLLLVFWGLLALIEAIIRLDKEQKSKMVFWNKPKESL